MTAEERAGGKPVAREDRLSRVGRGKRELRPSTPLKLRGLTLGEELTDARPDLALARPPAFSTGAYTSAGCGVRLAVAEALLDLKEADVECDQHARVAVAEVVQGAGAAMPDPVTARASAVRTTLSMGRATALMFAREGALVVGCDVAIESAEEHSR